MCRRQMAVLACACSQTWTSNCRQRLALLRLAATSYALQTWSDSSNIDSLKASSSNVETCSNLQVPGTISGDSSFGTSSSPSYSSGTSPFPSSSGTSSFPSSAKGWGGAGPGANGVRSIATAGIRQRLAKHHTARTGADPKIIYNSWSSPCEEHLAVGRIRLHGC